VIGISRKSDKAEDAKKLGADKYISTDEDKDWVKENARSIDLIISTVSSEKMPLEGYLSLLKTHGTYIQIGSVKPSLV
jgi:alcohol dehydrogenase (NADP+)